MARLESNHGFNKFGIGMKHGNHQPRYTHCILDRDKKAIPVDSILEFIEWNNANPGACLIAKTELAGGTIISTCFFGTYDLLSDWPVFETMVLNGPLPYCKRSPTWSEAESLHEAVVAALKLLLDDDSEQI